MKANCLRAAVDLAADVALADLENRYNAFDREARSTEVGDIRFGDARAGGVPAKSEQPQQGKEERQAHGATPRKSEGRSSRLSSNSRNWEERGVARQLARWEKLLSGAVVRRGRTAEGGGGGAYMGWIPSH
jgi:hypothetical protein